MNQNPNINYFERHLKMRDNVCKKNRISVAIDIGASSGRHIVKIYKNGDSHIIEAYRFNNYVDDSNDGPIWNVERIWQEIINGLRIIVDRYKTIDTIGIDTWGVDYVLLKNNIIISPVFAYRNNRTDTSVPIVHDILSQSQLYNITGIQFQKFNTLYQLHDDLIRGRLDEADDWLMLPEYFIYRLTDIKIHELTNATTTGMIDINTNDFSDVILKHLNYPSKLFKTPEKPGRQIAISPKIKTLLGLEDCKVVITATHDTASAIEGIDLPLETLYLSSGTWSLLGIKTNKTYISELSRNKNFSHEAGPDYVRFQKNIMGLWMIQTLKEELNISSYEVLIDMAQESSYKEVIDVNSDIFLHPKSMQDSIRTWLKKNNKPLPMTTSDMLNSVFYSLADAYSKTIDEIACITGKTFGVLHVFGGGAKNEYLNQLIEDKTKLKLKVHPVEATALGNLHIQSKHTK